MIQNFTTTFYKASKYRCSSPAPWHTPMNLYNRCIQVYSKLKTNSDLFIIPKKYVKHKSKPQSTENLVSSNTSEKLSRSERSKLLKLKKRQAAYDRIHHPNYNPYSPLLEEDIINQKKKPTMANKIARLSFRMMLDNATNAVKATTTSDQVMNEGKHTNEDTDPANLSIQGHQQPTSEITQTKLSTEEYIQNVSDKYAPKNLSTETTRIRASP
jgi:hypothetical protein